MKEGFMTSQNWEVLLGVVASQMTLASNAEHIREIRANEEYSLGLCRAVYERVIAATGKTEKSALAALAAAKAMTPSSICDPAGAYLEVHLAIASARDAVTAKATAEACLEMAVAAERRLGEAAAITDAQEEVAREAVDEIQTAVQGGEDPAATLANFTAAVESVGSAYVTAAGVAHDFTLSIAGLREALRKAEECAETARQAVAKAEEKAKETKVKGVEEETQEQEPVAGNEVRGDEARDLSQIYYVHGADAMPK